MGFFLAACVVELSSRVVGFLANKAMALRCHSLLRTSISTLSGFHFFSFSLSLLILFLC